MFEIKFLKETINKLKPCSLEDIVDKAHSFATVGLLTGLALILCAKQIFGDAISCMAPAESPGSWIPYINSYCFVTGTYVIDKAVEHMPQDEDNSLDGSKIDVSYYQWVPYVLVLQAAFFYGPHWFWSLYRKSQADVSFNLLVDKCVKSRGLSAEKYEEEVEDVVLNIVKTYEHRQIKNKSAGLGSSGTFAYLVSKLLNVMNVVAQLVLVSIFIGNAGFGIQVIDNAMDGQYWSQTGYFPRSAFCTFKQSTLSGEQSHTVQCVLMMNMLYEKIFVLLYVWFIVLLFASVINVLYVFVRYVSPVGQRSSTRRYLKAHPLRDVVEWRKFADLQLEHDGLLLLRFIESNAGFVMASEVACKLYDSLRKSSVQVEEGIAVGKGDPKIKFSEGMDGMTGILCCTMPLSRTEEFVDPLIMLVIQIPLDRNIIVEYICA